MMQVDWTARLGFRAMVSPLSARLLAGERALAGNRGAGIQWLAALHATDTSAGVRGPCLLPPGAALAHTCVSVSLLLGSFYAVLVLPSSHVKREGFRTRKPSPLRQVDEGVAQREHGFGQRLDHMVALRADLC